MSAAEPTPPGMSPDDMLKMIESQHAMAQVLQGFKAAIVAEGWSEHNAEQAAITIYDNAVKVQLARMAAGLDE